MEILLIGGTGFLGRHVAGALTAAGHSVTALSRGRSAPGDDVEALVCDRQDPAALVHVLEGRRFDLTMDLAAYDASDVDRLFRVPGLVLGPYVLISTGQVYLVTASRRAPYREEDSASSPIAEPENGTPDHREWSYGVGKRRAESALLGLRASHGVRGVIVRLPVLVGEGDSSRRLWAYLERMLDGGPILLPAGGRSFTRFLHPGDVGRALLQWIEGPWPARPVYNLAQPEIVPLRAVLEAVARSAGIRPRFVEASWEEIDRAGLTRAISPYAGSWVSILDPTRAETEWGFAGTPIADYLPGVVRWHLENRPETSHPGYAERGREVDVARRLECEGAPEGVRRA